MRRLRCSRTGATATLGEASANSRTKAGLPNRMWGGYIRPAFVASVPPFVVSLRSGLMAPRAYWKGYLKLSLVSCPIALSPAASSSERISFRQINKKTGNRLRQQLVDEETREPVEAEDKGRGYEIDKGVYVEIEDEELEAIQVESRHTIDIDSFVPAAQIDKRFYDS